MCTYVHLADWWLSCADVILLRIRRRQRVILKWSSAFVLPSSVTLTGFYFVIENCCHLPRHYESSKDLDEHQFRRVTSALNVTEVEVALMPLNQQYH